MQKVIVADKFAQFADQWSPRIVGELNGQHVKLVRVQGDFVWHKHDDEDEMFMVIEGRMEIAFRDRVVSLEKGEFVIVPRGVEHKPSATEEARVMLFEPAGTLNTGDAPRNARTVVDLEVI